MIDERYGAAGVTGVLALPVLPEAWRPRAWRLGHLEMSCARGKTKYEHWGIFLIAGGDGKRPNKDRAPVAFRALLRVTYGYGG